MTLTGCGGNGGRDGAASSDASLSGLSLTGVTLDQLFQPSQQVYSASVGFLQPSVTLMPVATDAGATIHINGNRIASGNPSMVIELAEGINLISVEVTAEDGVSTRDYDVAIVRGDVDALTKHQQGIQGSYADTYDYFARSVSILGDTLVVGAPGVDSSAEGGEADNSANNAGAAFVFTRSVGI